VVRLEEIDKLVFAFDHKQVLVEWRDRQFT